MTPPADDEYGSLVPPLIRLDPVVPPVRERATPTLLQPASSLTVGQLTQRLKAMLESTGWLQQVRVEGEVTDYRGPQPSGHHYFTLKDDDAAVSCVLWAGTARKMRTLPRNGAAMMITGDLSLYAKRGTYQLVVSDLADTGQGAAWVQYLELKSKLQAEGLFEETRKRVLPAFPRVIGVITSGEGAALRDILKILNRRGGHVTVRIAPTLVQGPTAAASILKALYALDNDPEIDVLILARGGGSFEDLACFNDEDLVRAVAQTTTPIITGVGHETDFTLVDFVSDLRAPTPTGAAALACPDGAELRQQIRQELSAATALLSQRIRTAQERLGQLLQRPSLARAGRELGGRRQEIDELALRCGAALARGIRQRAAKLNHQETVLRETHPDRLLRRGFALVRNAEGALLRSVAGIAPGTQLAVRLSDGTLPVTTTGVAAMIPLESEGSAR